jgi:two-component system NtrC family sensor kinase
MKHILQVVKKADIGKLNPNPFDKRSVNTIKVIEKCLIENHNISDEWDISHWNRTKSVAENQNKKTHGPAYYSDFRIKIALRIVIVSLAPLLLVAGIILYQFQGYANQMVHAHLDQLVLKHRQKIDDFLKQKLSDISYLSKGYEFSRLKEKPFLQQRLRALQVDYSYVFVDLGVIDDQGRQVSYAGPFDLDQADYSDSEWFQKARVRDTYISDVFLGMRGQPHFIVAVKREWQGRMWLVRATIDFMAFNTLVEDFTRGKTGTAFILNRQGEFQTRAPKGTLKLTLQQYKNLFKMGEDARGNKTGDRIIAPSVLGQNDLFQIAREYEPKIDRYTASPPHKYTTFTVEKKGEDSTRCLVVAAFLKNDDWLLIFQQEKKDAFAKLNETQLIAVFITFAGALLIIFMAFFISGQLVKRIARLDSEKEVMNQQIVETGKLASIGELAAGIAHEINNPVAIMVEEAGWIQDLLSEGIDKGDNFEEFKRALNQIQTQGHRCKGITHKLLSFARKTDSRVETLQINEFVTEVVDLLSQKFKYANINVDVQLHPELPTIQASATEIQQVLMNILQNAVYAMEKTGGKISILTGVKDQNICISINDTGPGIASDNLARIFDPFFTTRPVGKGTGLGLSICYGIINKMGGRIDVESKLDEGTTFTIVLPLDDTSAPKS